MPMLQLRPTQGFHLGIRIIIWNRKLFNKSLKYVMILFKKWNILIQDQVLGGTVIPIRYWEAFDSFLNGFSAQKGV